MTQTKSQKLQFGIVATIAVFAIGMISVNDAYAADLLSDMLSADISIEEAVAIAVAHLKTESSNLVEIGIEKDDDILIYELEFETDTQEISVEVDPNTGEILDVESEDLEEDDDEEDDDEEDDDDEDDDEEDDDDD